MRLAVSYRPPALPVRLSAFSQVAFFAISDYALPGCRAPQPKVIPWSSYQARKKHHSPLPLAPSTSSAWLRPLQGAGSLQVTGKGHLRGGSKHLGSCKHNENGCHLPKARCWLGLAPLSPRAALRANPLSDLGGSTELAPPPLAGMMRLPRTIRHRLEILNGTRCARKAVISSPAYSPPCRTLTL